MERNNLYRIEYQQHLILLEVALERHPQQYQNQARYDRGQRVKIYKSLIYCPVFNSLYILQSIAQTNRIINPNTIDFPITNFKNIINNKI